MKNQGTWDVCTEIMEANGFKCRVGVFPTGLEGQIRDMLTAAYVKGYSNGHEAHKETVRIVNQNHEHTNQR